MTTDLSTAAAIFPDAKSIFRVALKPLGEIKDNCLVVLDTNVLLVPYTINPKGLGEIAKAYEGLLNEKRLIIPAQVAREFAKNRPNKLTELFQQLSGKRSRLQGYQRGQYPLLEGLPEYNKVLELEKELDELSNQYRESLSKVLDHVRNWIWNDPVSLLYGRLFAPETVVELKAEKETIEADIKRRIEQKIPPGYKDAAKDDFGAGDMLIWNTILQVGEERKKDVIFVSADGKPDWFHQSDGPLYPRFELVDEFRRHSGSSFHILKLSEFLDLYDAGGDVVAEVRQEEAKLSPETAPPTKGLSRIAYDAIAAWLLSNYSNHLIEHLNDENLNFRLTTPDNRKLGVVVKITMNPLAWQENFVRMLSRSVRRGSQDVHELLIFLVTENEKVSISLGSQLSELVQEVEHDIPITAFSGWLVGGSVYAESTRVRV